jgi:hypothetical protein
MGKAADSAYDSAIASKCHQRARDTLSVPVLRDEVYYVLLGIVADILVHGTGLARHGLLGGSLSGLC